MKRKSSEKQTAAQACQLRNSYGYPLGALRSFVPLGTGEEQVYRKLRKICRMFLALEGLDDRVEIIWDDISLQDIAEQAQADYYKAQAERCRAELAN